MQPYSNLSQIRSFDDISDLIHLEARSSEQQHTYDQLMYMYNQIAQQLSMQLDQEVIFNLVLEQIKVM
jgi:hypothetical protein